MDWRDAVFEICDTIRITITAMMLGMFLGLLLSNLGPFPFPF